MKISRTNTAINRVTVLYLLIMQAKDAQSYSVSKDGLSVSTSTIIQRHRPGELVFAEEFYELDTNVWEREIALPGNKNGEFQMYSDSAENSYVRDGILYIKPTYTESKSDKDNQNIRRNRSLDIGSSKKEVFEQDIINPIVSARLNTRQAFSFRYGQLEVRAKLPEGDWIWPAIWFLPQGYTYGLWPNSGEVDLMESRGNRELFTANGEDIGSNQIGSTLHFGLNRTTDQWRLAHFKRNDSLGFNSEFHSYGMIWTPDEIAFTLDGEIIGLVTPPAGGFWEMGNFTGKKIWSDNKMSPFDQPFNIVLNVAVGGTFGFFPDNTGPKKKPWINSSPTAILDFWEAKNEWQPTWKGEDSALQVDYVRIWAL